MNTVERQERNMRIIFVAAKERIKILMRAKSTVKLKTVIKLKNLETDYSARLTIEALKRRVLMRFLDI